MNLLVIVKNDVSGAWGSRQCGVSGVNVVNALNLTSKYREAVLWLGPWSTADKPFGWGYLLSV